MLTRYITRQLQEKLTSHFSVLLLGPRQVGKTTLVTEMLHTFTQNKTPVLEYPLQNPKIRLEIARDPSRIIRQAQALSYPIVYIDEAQKVSEVFDAAQVLIDNGEATCILTGSSARKLRRNNVNLLPGRITRFSLDPLMWAELGYINGSTITELSMHNLTSSDHASYSFIDTLVYGMLPAVVSLSVENRIDLLHAYSVLYLEEEIRQEALSRNIGAFARFLELAALESGTSPNLTKLSQQSGITLATIRGYFEILSDTLIVETIEPFLKHARKRLLTTPRYYFFDTGVRNALARLPLTPELLSLQKGVLFEHAVVLELARRIRALRLGYKLYYWRTSNGAEVDCIIDTGTQVIPVEIKAMEWVPLSEVRGLRIFLDEYADIAPRGYVVMMGDRKEQLTQNITAIPWHML